MNPLRLPPIKDGTHYMEMMNTDTVITLINSNFKINVSTETFKLKTMSIVSFNRFKSYGK